MQSLPSGLVIALVFACLGWDRRFFRAPRAEICLMGIQGEFQELSIEGEHGGRIASAWQVTDDER